MKEQVFYANEEVKKKYEGVITKKINNKILCPDCEIKDFRKNKTKLKTEEELINENSWK